MKGLAASGAVAGLGLWRTPRVWAQAPARQPTIELSGTNFDLRIGETPVNITGRPRTAYTVNGSLPAPTLRWREGDTVTLRVANTLSEDEASIHWHGILLPANMDGVPGLSFGGIRPVVAADGQYVHPVEVDEFRIATAEVYDVIVEPADGVGYFELDRPNWSEISCTK